MERSAKEPPIGSSLAPSSVKVGASIMPASSRVGAAAAVKMAILPTGTGFDFSIELMSAPLPLGGAASTPGNQVLSPPTIPGARLASASGPRTAHIPPPARAKSMPQERPLRSRRLAYRQPIDCRDVQVRYPLGVPRQLHLGQNGNQRPQRRP